MFTLKTQSWLGLWGGKLNLIAGPEITFKFELPFSNLICHILFHLPLCINQIGKGRCEIVRALNLNAIGLYALFAKLQPYSNLK